MWIKALKQEMDHKRAGLLFVRFCIATTFHASNLINGVEEEKSKLSHKYFRLSITHFINDFKRIEKQVSSGQF